MKRITAIILAAFISVSAAFGSVSITASAAEAQTSAFAGEEMPAGIVVSNYAFAYDFGNHRTYGITSTNDSIDFEAVMGLILDTNGKDVTISTYTNKPETRFFTGEITVYDDVSGAVIQTFDNLEMAKDKVVFTPSKEGLYNISMDLGKLKCSGYVYFDGSKAYTCRAGDKTVKRHMNQWNSLMADADPKDYLSNKSTTYPTSGMYGRPVHVDEWENKSDELLKDREDWSDEIKAYILTSYLAKNYAYDVYRVHQLNNCSRADEAGSYEDKYYMYYTKCGTCWDYVNALVIMLRHQGIPATSVENRTHTAVAVYIQDKWLCIDPTELVRQKCETKDTSVENWKSCPHDSFNNAFLAYPGDAFKTHDIQVWSPEVIALCKNIYGTHTYSGN